MACLLLCPIAVMKSAQWGMSPATVALVQLPTLAYILFGVLSLRSPAVAAWAKCQFEGKGFVSKNVESLILLALMFQQGIISSLLPYDGYDHLPGYRVVGHSTRWLISAMTHSFNLVFVALFRAEVAPMHARRYDIVAMATLCLVAYFSAFFAKFGHVRFLTHALFQSPAHLFFKMWVLPIAVGTCARAVARRQTRIARDAQMKKKLKSM